MIKFNKPYYTGKETYYIQDAIHTQRKISGNGFYTKKCQNYFEEKYGYRKTLMTTSCTDALEMASILIGLEQGDEVIVPSFTFVSSANAFVLRGAKMVFCDSERDNPNMDANLLEALITDKTKAIVVVHYAGVACDMDKIMALAKQHNIFVVEDAAQAIDSTYKGRPLGGIGHLGAISFHETKNIISGEGGLLIVNDESMVARSEILWEKGTNRSAFFRGEIDKYNWVDIGSSYLPSDILSAFLWSQLESLEDIQKRRIEIWNRYYEGLKELETRGTVELPRIPDYAVNNAHMFYVICDSESTRSELIKYLNAKEIFPVSHYISLHKSPYVEHTYSDRVELPNSDKYSDRLLRLPYYYELKEKDQELVISEIKEFFKG